MRYLDGSFLCPVQYTTRRNQENGIENPEYTDWMDEDSSIIMWLNSTISDFVIAYFTKFNSSHQLWSSMEDKFARDSSRHSIQL